MASPEFAIAAKRLALVIGNSSYTHVPALANPKNDAADMAAKLKDMGFEVVSGIDLDLVALRDLTRKFIKTLSGAEVALFYYAGHGLQVNGENYIVPVDAQMESYEDLEFEAVSMGIVLTAMERNTNVNLVFLDACRDNPLANNLARSMGTRSGSIGRGLARLGSSVGSLIAFATQPGNVALDGTGRNSPFTKALLRHLGTPGQGITQDMVLVRRDVLEATGGKQVPWDSSSLTGDVILVPKLDEKSAKDTGTQNTSGKSAEETGSETAVELAFWDTVKDADDPLMYQTYLEQYPNGAFVPLARVKLKILEAERKSSQDTSKVVETETQQPTSRKTVVASIDTAESGPFDGMWRLTRHATNSSCGWKELSQEFVVKGGKVSGEGLTGTIASNGALNISLGFINNGKPGRNTLKGKVSGAIGSGRFQHVGGSCRGTIRLSKV
ncbi:caspase [Nordella sp. HKS 07]|nr:caspase [Nordella sp. HKS 07]